MGSSSTKAGLPEPRRNLVELLQDVNFGRLESVQVRRGQPVLNPRPLVVREHKFGGENGPRPELGNTDFLLKRQVVELFAFLDELKDGVIDVLEVRHGLPFRVIVREGAA